MSVVFRWVATRVLRLVLSRYRWLARLTVVVPVVKWFAARRRRRAVVTLGRGDTLVIGINEGGHSRNGGRGVG